MQLQLLVSFKPKSWAPRVVIAWNDWMLGCNHTKLVVESGLIMNYKQATR